MIEVPIVVDEDEVKVANFVESIGLQVDIGPRGERGSIIFSGIGDPESKVQPPSPTADPVFQGVSEIRVNDFYIDVGSAGYAWLYQYQPSPLNWTLVTRMNPPIYSAKHSLLFTSGATDPLSIPLADIIGASTTSLTADQFIITVNPLVAGGATDTYIVNPTSITKIEPNLDVVFHTRKFTTTAVSVPASVTLDCLVSVGVGA